MAIAAESSVRVQRNPLGLGTRLQRAATAILSCQRRPPGAVVGIDEAQPARWPAPQYASAARESCLAILVRRDLQPL